MSNNVEPRAYLRPPTDLDLPLWRYMSFDKFKSLIESSSIYFCRSDRFDDKLEGSYGLANNDPKYNSLYAPVGADPALTELIRAQMRATISSQRVENYISCWHVNYSESARMWKEYCKDSKGKISNDGICITTTYQRLSTEINGLNQGIQIGFVNYIDHSGTFIPEFDFVAPYYCKSKRQFVHEQELRLLWMTPHRTGSWTTGQNAPLGHLATVNLQNLIESVIPSPKALDDHVEVVKSMCTSVGIDEAKVKESELRNL